MCGIFAIHDPSGRFLEEERLAAAERAMAHRGPDGRGLFRSGPVALIHRRLILIDPEGGAQPMTDASGRFTLVFNGTIYNHAVIRGFLRDYPFQTRSDTEVLLALLARDGLAGLRRVRGEYALVLHDAVTGELLAARDRHGTRPLYVAEQGGTIAVASCVRSFFASGVIQAAPDLETIDDYLSFMNYTPDRTFFRGVRSIRPGHAVTIRATGLREIRHDAAQFGAGATPCGGELRALFETAVTRALTADVPVGCYLSGGVDSTSILAVAARRRPGIAAFTTGFDSTDERPIARATAASLGVRLREREIRDDVVARRLPLLIRELESPRMGHCELNDAAADLARSEVISVLSGCGGDEILGGYTPHFTADADQVAVQVEKFRVVLRADAKATLYQPELLSIAAVARDGASDRSEESMRAFARDSIAIAQAKSPVHQAMAYHAACYLPGLLLVDDAIAMSRALDVRVPFLDRDFVDAAWSLPAEALFDGVCGKKAFRDAMRPLAPAGVLDDAMKRGFGAPESWMRGSAAPWIRKLFSGAPASSSFIKPDEARAVIDDYLVGRNQRSRRVWTLLNLELWTRLFLLDESPDRLIEAGQSAA